MMIRSRKDKVIHGLKVFGGNGSLEAICNKNDVQEILISFRSISPERISEVRKMCQNSNIDLKRALLKIESVDFD